MNISEKLVQTAEKAQQVYDAGYAKGKLDGMAEGNGHPITAYFNSFQDAFEGVAHLGEDGVLGAYIDDKGVINLVALGDIEMDRNAVANIPCTINLEGNTVTLIGSACFVVKTEGVCFKGGKIVKDVQEALVDEEGHAQTAFCIYSYSGLDMSECTVELKGCVGQSLNAVYVTGPSTFTDCDISAIGTDSGQCIKNCCALSGTGAISINGGTYFGTREALSITGAPLLINGGTFSGCVHGSYLSGEVRIKNATLRNSRNKLGIPYTLEHLGAVYTGEGANLYMNACTVGTDPTEGLMPGAFYGIVVNNRYADISVYLSNITFDGYFATDLRIDYGRTAYLGENVAYRSVYFGHDHADQYTDPVGILDDKTYRGAVFAWDELGNINNSYINGKRDGIAEIFRQLAAPEVTSYASRFRNSAFTDIPAMTLRGSIAQAFYSCTELISAGPLNTDACTTVSLAFALCPKLQSVELTALQGASASTTFKECYALENVAIDTIAVDISFQWSPLLTLESAKGIIEALTGSGKTITFTAQTMALLDADTEEDWRAYIANKGWTLKEV